jgi:arylsulfatase A-like enzyme
MNPTGAGAGVMHYGFTLPKVSRLQVEKVLGPEPPDAYPSEGRNRYAVDAYLKIGIPQHQPKVTYMWLTDPDHTAHKYGIGSELAERSLRGVDAHIGRILDAHAKSKARVNVFVTSDHGFSTYKGGANLLGILMGAGLKRSPSSSDIVISGNAIYVNEGGSDRVQAIAETLMKAPNIGAIFSKAKEPGSTEGVVPGTLSFELIHWNHPRSGDLLVSPRWTDEKNEKGYQGITYQSGVAGHGSASRWDIHNTLIAFGPDMKRGARNKTPTGNVDIAPTLAWLLGIDDYMKMDGRPLKELFHDGPGLDSIEVQRQVYRAENRSGDYRLALSASYVEGKRYIDFAKVERP